MVDIATVLGFHNNERRKNSSKRKRVGRGRGSGLGKTCGKGGKGQSIRAGYSLVAGFEGGQTPLYRRMPIHGFNNFTRKSYKALSIEKIIYYIEKGKLSNNITISNLIESGLIKKYEHVKLLGAAETSLTFSIEVNAASKSALESMKKGGGNVKIISSSSRISETASKIIPEETKENQKSEAKDYPVSSPDLQNELNHFDTPVIKKIVKKQKTISLSSEGTHIKKVRSSKSVAKEKNVDPSIKED